MKKWTFLLACLILLSLFTACGKAESNASSAESDSEDKYNTLLTHWCEGQEYIDEDLAAYPDFFGGLYIDDDQKTVIMITNRKPETLAYYENLISLDNVVFKKVKYSYATLLTEKAIAASRWEECDRLYPGAVTGLGISVQKNAVNLYINTGLVKENGWSLKKVCKAITDFKSINIIETTGPDLPA